MAKMFEVKTMNGSSVMPKMAGTLSTANSTSVLSTTSNTRNNGVMQSRPSSRDEEGMAVLLVVAAGDRQQPPGNAEHEALFRDALRRRRAAQALAAV